MAQPTYTLATLRKRVCRRLGMRFFKYFDENSTLTGGGASGPIDSALSQVADFWNGGWLYMINGDAAGDVRYISDFAGGTITPDRDLSAAPGTSNYQVLDRFTPFEIHAAINEAIKEGYPAFFQIVTDESLVVQEDTLEYSLSSLSTTPWRIYQVWVERHSGNAIQSAVSSSSNNTVVLPADLTNVDSNWKIGTYEGTGKGQLRGVSSVSGQTITVDSNWTTNPDTTTQVTLWDPNEQHISWYNMNAVEFDSPEFPTKLRFQENWPMSYGMRIRILYTAEPTQLSAETDTTVVPDQYVVPKALAFLYSGKEDGSSVDRSRYRRLAEARDEEAERYKHMAAFVPPNRTLWMPHDLHGMSRYDQIDPLDWGRRF